MSRRRVLLVAALLGLSTELVGQEPDTAATAGLPPADTVLRMGPTPAGAFLRSLLIPGWGQGAVGSYWRGGVYFGGHVANTFMLVKTRGRLQEIRRVGARREGMVRDSVLTADPQAPPDSLAAAVERDLVVRRALALERSREQQQEDWLVWSAFWLLANAVDAYVAAQLADFPADVLVRPTTTGTLQVGIGIPAGRRR